MNAKDSAFVMSVAVFFVMQLTMEKTMPVRTAVRTRTKPLNINQTAPGQIVPYRPPSPAQTITPVPRGTLDAPASTRVLPVPSPDIIDAEIISPLPQRPPRTEPTPAPRRPVVSRDGRTSSEAARPQYYPQYPNPADGWRTLADYAAWQNGMNRAQIDEEADAYDFTKDWGKTGGMLYPYTENGPRTPITSENFDRANRYRARNGLPAIDRFGYEQPQPANPGLQPGSAFSPSPFGLQPDVIFAPDATPSNFDRPAYDFSRDPETGVPYTDLQRRRGDELGRPPWHINPTTGNPWGSDEPGTPLPNPFQGYPGGAIRFPSPDRGISQRGDGVWTVSITAQYPNGAVSEPLVYTVTGRDTDVWSWRDNGTGKDIMINERVFYPNWTLNSGGGFPFIYPSFRPNIEVSPLPDTSPDVTASPFGQPLPQPNARPNARPNTRPLPQPVQDPRVNPTPVPSPPYNPNANPNSPPNSLPNPVKPNPGPNPGPVPNLPGSPYPPYAPVPFPRTSPVGTPQPSLDPSTQPTSSHPQNPRPYTQTDRTKNTPVNPGPGAKEFCDCPDPCPTEEIVTIPFLKFVSCRYTTSGEPNFFDVSEIQVPKSQAPALKILLDSTARTQALECSPCCEWVLTPSSSRVLFDGYPPLSGLNVQLPEGCNSFVIEFDASEVVADKSLRNMRRMTNPITDETTFINTAVVYIINQSGNAIHSQELWVPKWEFIVPLHYREERMTVRLMAKTSNSRFRIIDSGKTWASQSITN